MGATAIVLAAGSGERFGGTVAKALVRLRGHPLVVWSITAFARAASVDRLIIVTRPDLIAAVEELAASALGDQLEATVVPGGAARPASAAAGLATLTGCAADHVVLIHDAARPLVSPATIDAVAAAVANHGGAAPGLPTTDTIWRVVDGTIAAVPDRTELWQAQTPQGFHYAVIDAAHRHAATDDHPTSDDCGIVHRHRPDLTIAVVPGKRSNIKITHQRDLAIAESLAPAVPPCTI